MLSPDQIAHIERNFALYEHEWKFPACYLGEPFLISDCLLYYDGRTVNLAAFPVGQPERLVSTAEITQLLDRLEFARTPELLHAWGRLDGAAAVDIRGKRLTLVNDVTEVNPGEFTLDVRKHDIGELKEARKAIQSANKKGLWAQTRHVDYLSADHFRLVEEWVRTRPIRLPSVSAMGALPAYVRNRHVDLVEIWQDERCCGLGVLAAATPTDAVLIATFSERYPGARIEDRLMAEVIEVCRARGVHRLHLGYPGTDSLARFKRKWGASQSGPGYQEAIYCLDERATSWAASFSFFWASRMHQLSANRQE